VGEGAGALLLEDLDHARKRGALIYAELVGGGMAADAYHLTGTPPDGYGAALGMTKALADAGIEARHVNYINAHATSTPLGDLSELNAIKSVFGDLPVVISATKSMTGHLLGAAGAIESVICILAIKNNHVPATINTQHIDEQAPAGLPILLGSAKKMEVNFALNNTFGFGGHTASTLFKKYSND
jgi:3-oxoacyl-[acyl-carrier-protein] synthase II